MADHVTVIVGDDGEPAALVHGPRLLDAEGQQHMTAIVEAARTHMLEQTEMLIVQELLATVRLARACIPDGAVQAGVFGVQDGAEIRSRLKVAAAAAHAALSPAYATRLQAQAAAAALEEQESST